MGCKTWYFHFIDETIEFQKYSTAFAISQVRVMSQVSEISCSQSQSHWLIFVPSASYVDQPYPMLGSYNSHKAEDGIQRDSLR